MPTLTFQKLWNNPPYPNTPCDSGYFPNQCAIRMGVALGNSGVSLGSFRGAKCYPGLKHNPRHILRAQELANWLKTQRALVGNVAVHKNTNSKAFAGKRGIVFIKNGWGPTDHIDVWNGSQLKGGSPTYFARGQEVWFWELK